MDEFVADENILVELGEIKSSIENLNQEIKPGNQILSRGNTGCDYRLY